MFAQGARAVWVPDLVGYLLYAHGSCGIWLPYGSKQGVLKISTRQARADWAKRLKKRGRCNESLIVVAAMQKAGAVSDLDKLQLPAQHTQLMALASCVTDQGASPGCWSCVPLHMAR
jgi:hypothetical protein